MLLQKNKAQSPLFVDYNGVSMYGLKTHGLGGCCKNVVYHIPIQMGYRNLPKIYLEMINILEGIVILKYDNEAVGGPRWQSGNTLGSHLWDLGSVPGTASSGKAGSCLPLANSLQYRTLTKCMYWFPLPFQLPVVI